MFLAIKNDLRWLVVLLLEYIRFFLHENRGQQSTLLLGLVQRSKQAVAEFETLLFAGGLGLLTRFWQFLKLNFLGYRVVYNILELLNWLLHL